MLMGLLARYAEEVTREKDLRLIKLPAKKDAILVKLLAKKNAMLKTVRMLSTV
jgi:hypothetical protein